MARLNVVLAIELDSTLVDPQDVADELLLNGAFGRPNTYEGKPVLWFQAGWLPPEVQEVDEVLLGIDDA